MKKYKTQNQYRYPGYYYARTDFYFIAICAKNRETFFGPCEIGRIAADCWQKIPKHFSFVKLDEFIIMPDHLHGIIE